jgi:predicted kinase
MPESDIQEFKKHIFGEPELALTANYVPNQKSKMPSPIRPNLDYGEIPNWIDRVKFEEKKREERKARIDIILKTTTFEGRMERISQREQPSLIMTVGITGAGKSRWIQSLPKDEYVIVSPDEIRQELTGNISDQTQNGKVWFLAKQRTVDALNSGKSVILDATNVDRKSRKNFVQGLPADIRLKAKIFEVDPEIAKERIRKQIERGENRSNVPPDVTMKMHEKFKNQSKPEHLREEGFEII